MSGTEWDLFSLFVIMFGFTLLIVLPLGYAAEILVRRWVRIYRVRQFLRRVRNL